MSKDYDRFKTRRYLDATRDFLEKEYRLKFVKEGKQYSAYCPFHHDKERSLKLYCKSYQGKPEKVRLHCFGNCTLEKPDFDIFHFVVKKDNCLPRQAYRKVEEYFTKVASSPITCSISRKVSAVKVKEPKLDSHPEEIIPVVTEAAKFYHRILLTCQDPEVEETRTYLRQRGVDEGLIKEFMLGYAPKLGSRVKGLAWHFKEDFLKRYPLYEKSGLFTLFSGINRRFINKNYYIKGPASYYGDFLSRRIIFPLFDEKLRIVSLLGRKVGKISPASRYKMLPRTPKRKILYGYEKVQPFLYTARNFTIVEGPLDLISYWKKLPSNAHSVVVACLGNDFSKKQQELLFKDALRWKQCLFKIKIDILFDQGAEARAAKIRQTLTGSETLKGTRTEIYVNLLPKDSKDPDEFFNKHRIQGPLIIIRFLNLPNSPAVMGAGESSLEIPSQKEKGTSFRTDEYTVNRKKLTELLLKGEKITSKTASKKRVEKIVNFIKSNSSKEGAKETIGIPAPLVDPKYTEKMGGALILLLNIWMEQWSKGRRVVTTAKKRSKNMNIAIRTYHKYQEKLIKLGFLVREKRGQESIFTVRYSAKYLKG